ncbi:porin family protein [uncultured Polaribacter sp.]|uniref:porin family protein n=1 Tax=uncultured Polaribacter sp. TaxID=174711 RepID=UPI002623189D|nr:porin family protein [uncultured Polaribacter sp.]
MHKIYIVLFTFLFSSGLWAQKDSLQLGDKYAEDQLYISLTYGQLTNQPAGVLKSNFSYAFSTGFIKDFILNKRGSVSIAGGLGVNYNSFNHSLRVDEVNGNTTTFSIDNAITSNSFNTFNLELPLELRWRTSTAQKFSFWRIYTGVKLLYNLSNTFSFVDSNEAEISYNNVSAYNNLQLGLTLSAGYDAFNIHAFYGLSPIFKDANLNGVAIHTKILQFGLIYYLL